MPIMESGINAAFLLLLWLSSWSMAAELHRGNGTEPGSLAPHLAQGIPAADI